MLVSDATVVVLNAISALFLFILTAIAVRIGKKGGFSPLWKCATIGFGLSGAGRALLTIVELVDLFTSFYGAQSMVYMSISISTFGTGLLIIGFTALLKIFDGKMKKDAD